jgi:hypothetical protein
VPGRPGAADLGAGRRKRRERPARVSSVLHCISVRAGEVESLCCALGGVGVPFAHVIAAFRVPLVPGGWPVQDQVVEFDDLSDAEQALWTAFPGDGWGDLRSGDVLADNVSGGGGWGRDRVMKQRSAQG